MFKLFERRKKAESLTKKLGSLSDPEKGISKKISIKFGDDLRDLPCWMIWESPECKGSFCKMIREICQTEKTSLLLINTDSIQSRELPTKQQLSELCETPIVLSLSLKQEDADVAGILLASLIQHTFHFPAKVMVTIVLNSIELLPLIPNLQLSLSATRGRNIRYCLVSHNRKLLKEHWTREMYITTVDCCFCEMIREPITTDHANLVQFIPYDYANDCWEALERSDEVSID